MNVSNDTCVQRVKVALLQPSAAAGKPKLNRLRLFNRRRRPALTQSITSERFHALLQTLQNAHDAWDVYKSGKRLILETSSFDYNHLVSLLDRQGFSPRDYEVSVEYERKWGIL
ncbi:hypothetical protein B5M42_006965 [Paenibacillus athensensis]|uniref:Uncharacterized protein n=1 Tax=Paenibacillus athensensis TaxID=1967502 RepID=A0A4Y8Q1U4_9BACL|nr:hypothetical protein [Paenibacillus athensensis]MCD1258573.1 hypothetical protein [Paenibacillus athensensis]